MTIPARVRNLIRHDLMHTRDTYEVIRARHGVSMESMWRTAKAWARDNPTLPSGHDRRIAARLDRATALAQAMRDPVSNHGLEDVAERLGIEIDTARKLLRSWRRVNGISLSSPRGLNAVERTEALASLARGQDPRAIARRMHVPLYHILTARGPAYDC